MWPIATVTTIATMTETGTEIVTADTSANAIMTAMTTASLIGTATADMTTDMRATTVIGTAGAGGSGTAIGGFTNGD